MMLIHKTKFVRRWFNYEWNLWKNTKRLPFLCKSKELKPEHLSCRQEVTFHVFPFWSFSVNFIQKEPTSTNLLLFNTKKKKILEIFWMEIIICNFAFFYKVLSKMLGYCKKWKTTPDNLWGDQGKNNRLLFPLVPEPYGKNYIMIQ